VLLQQLNSQPENKSEIKLMNKQQEKREGHDGPESLT